MHSLQNYCRLANLLMLTGAKIKFVHETVRIMNVCQEAESTKGNFLYIWHTLIEQSEYSFILIYSIKTLRFMNKDY